MVHAKSGSPEPYGLGQEDFKDFLFHDNQSFHWNQVFGRILISALAQKQNVNRKHTFIDPKSSPKPLCGQVSLTCSQMSPSRNC